MHRIARSLFLCGLVSMASAAPLHAADAPGAGLVPGIEVLLRDKAGELHGKRIGLVTNMTGVDRELRSDVDLLAARKDFRLVALFGPEHGVRGDVQAGAHVASSRDAATGLPVHSLYGEHREPDAKMLQGIDLLLFDIQDVGARYYTYPYTLANLLRAAKKQGIPVWVLDRPNPLGGEKVEGPVLEPEFASFVGLFPIPARHGMTIGELARLFNGEFGIGARLTVVKMQGWSRAAAEPGGAMPWVPPSPNMPTRDTALVYPGMALIEGTNVSEGRGTTRPFETIGAPFVDAQQLASRLNALGLPGVRFRPTWFTPSFSKHQGVLCGGVQLHVVDRDAFQPFRTGLAVVKTLHDLYPRQFRFQSDAPGASANFFDKLAGNAWIREGIERGEPLDALQARWQPGLDRFIQVRRKYLLYPERAHMAGTVLDRAAHAPRLVSMDMDRADVLLETLRSAQGMLKSGKDAYFELLSGAPASYPMTGISPREAFLGLSFDNPFEIEQLPSDSAAWMPYRLSILPNGPGNMMWSIEAVLGIGDHLERVEMTYRPPPPS